LLSGSAGRKETLEHFLVAFCSQPVREVVAGSGTAGIEDDQKKQTVPQALGPENCLESVP
jgi:hypothetical protein